MHFPGKPKHALLIIISFTLGSFSFAQRAPSLHPNITSSNGNYVLEVDGKKIQAAAATAKYTLEQMQGKIEGGPQGLLIDFKNPEISGTLYYGFIPYGDSKHPHPVYFKQSGQILGGKGFIPIVGMKGRYDMIKWEEKGYGTIGYRVVTNKGSVLYDGIVSFKGSGPFKVDATMMEGPFVNLLSDQGATISFETNMAVEGKVVVDGRTFTGEKGKHHEIALSGLQPNTDYDYTVSWGSPQEQTYSFRTAPSPGSRTAFSFAYASDSRSGQGGGERDIYGANAYIMKKIMALSNFVGARFFQFSGDLIDGYLGTKEETALQYANWKRAIEPFAHYFPVWVSMGNHEALNTFFYGDGNAYIVDKFPYDTESAEAAFAEAFVMPTNGPESEDGASYDPNPRKVDFPSYKENVFYYTYDNVAVVVLNSDYWYAPSTGNIRKTSGGLHGYIMDQQLAWMEKTVMDLEANADIDHIFITQHTPFFPNGGHVSDDMWYRGNNAFRPFVAGKPLEKGIIERRDQLLELIVNKSTKVIAILTGDEHNYARTEVGPNTPIYLEDYLMPKIKLSRTIYQINNGAAGAPYYAQEKTPWTPYVSGFTTQNAVVFFHIEGKKIRMEVLNPDTMEKVDSLEMR